MTLEILPNSQSTTNTHETKPTSTSNNDQENSKFNFSPISDYFLPGSNRQADKDGSKKITRKVKAEFHDLFEGNECFKRTFSL